jgi:hypothetical protein
MIAANLRLEPPHAFIIAALAISQGNLQLIDFRPASPAYYCLMCK